jgi:hypothetical protein
VINAADARDRLTDVGLIDERSPPSVLFEHQGRFGDFGVVLDGLKRRSRTSARLAAASCVMAAGSRPSP